MHRSRLASLALSATLSATLSLAQAADLLPRADALGFVQATDTLAERRQLVSLTLSGDGAALLEALSAAAGRPDWHPAVRDALVHAYALELHALPRDAVPAAALVWLQAYRPQVAVPHEDHAAAWVPLYNVRAVAAGLENEWRREDAVLAGRALLAAQPGGLVAAWLEDPHPATRLGYLQALAGADHATRARLGQQARKRLPAEPELTSLAGEAALLEGDLEALGEVLAQGGGAGLAPLMRAAAGRLAPEATASLLDATLALDAGENAALAMAELAPAAAALPHTQRLLVERLGDPALGATAALVLSRVASKESLRRLNELAGEGGGAAPHARLSLALRADDQAGPR